MDHRDGLPGCGLRLWRRGLAPLASRRVRRAVARGLPTALEDPLQFLLGRPPASSAARASQEVERLRSDLVRSRERLGVWEGPGREAPRSPQWIAEVSSVDREWGVFLHLLAAGCGARTILELGACAGISSCYLASVDSCTRMIAVEASTSLAPLAEATLARLKGRAEVILAPFERALEDLAPALSAAVDVVFLDGDHALAPTLGYVERIVPLLRQGGLLVIDDIRWSREMLAAWREVSRRPGFSHVVDVGRMGVCVRGPDGEEPRRLGLSRALGWVLRPPRQGLEPTGAGVSVGGRVPGRATA